MIIYLALIVPLIVVIIASLIRKKPPTVKEVVPTIAVGVLFTFGSIALLNYVSVLDSEYWNGFALRAEHYEDWDQRVPCSHVKYCKDSDGNRYPCGTEHSYDVEYHPEYFQVIDSNGLTVNISKSFFNELSLKFGNKSFIDMRRNYHTNDGDKYVTEWDGSYERFQLIVTKHNYVNKVGASNTVVRWLDVDPTGLFKYSDEINSSSLLGISDPAARNKLDYFNAKFGASKQIRVMVLVFNDSIDAALRQEHFWRGGNKNELVICVGLENGLVSWGYTFSWTDNREIIAACNGEVARHKGAKFDALNLADWIHTTIPEMWVRKEFSEFDWIWVEPSMLAILFTYAVAIASTIAVIFFLDMRH